MGEISEKEALLMEKNQIREELQSDHLAYQFGEGWLKTFCIYAYTY